MNDSGHAAATHTSVLTERPGAAREWSVDTSAALWIAMGLAVVALLGVGTAHWATPKVRRGETAVGL